MKTYLSPCPFCGGTPKLIVTDEERDCPEHSFVKCKTCGASGGRPEINFWRCSNPNCESSEEAVKLHDNEAVNLWNKRANYFKLKLQGKK